MATPDALVRALSCADNSVPLPVFPCAPPGSKRPMTARGFHDATTDPEQVEAWWQQHPEANIGVPTGAASGVVVVDVDVHGPVNGFNALERAHRAGLVSGRQLLVSTPSGGMHAYYSATAGLSQRSWQVARGRRTEYRVRRINVGQSSPMDSDRLRDFLNPRPAPTPTSSGRVREINAERLAAWVSARSEGERNRGLFWAACRLAENDTPPSDTYAALAPAAEHAGLTRREVSTTIRSAYRTTHPSPRASADEPGEVPRREPEQAAGRVLS